MSGPAPARRCAFAVLFAVARRGAYAHLALEQELAGRRLAPEDAALASEITRGAMTWQRLLDRWIDRLAKGRRPDPAVAVILRMALYQLRFLDRVPAYAALSDAVELAKERAPHAAAFVNGVLRAATRETEWERPLADGCGGRAGACCPEEAPAPEALALSPAEFALRASYPDWLAACVGEALGERAGRAALLALNRRPVRTLRVNRLRAARADVLASLCAAGVDAEPSPCAPEGIRLPPGVNPVQLQVYRDGLCSLQGESSMLIAPLLEPRPGMAILDACAAPGGKAAHIAELADDRARVTAVDLHPHRAALVRAAAARLHLTSVRVETADARSLRGRYDAVLLDAPCSGIGTIARKPDLKWRLTPGALRELADLQAELLLALADAVRPGGLFVYSTCTLAAAENERQIERFLAARPDFCAAPFALSGGEVAGTARILPQSFGGDGFFVARMIRSV